MILMPILLGGHARPARFLVGIRRGGRGGRPVLPPLVKIRIRIIRREKVLGNWSWEVVEKRENRREIYSRFSCSSLTKSKIPDSLTVGSSPNFVGRFLTPISNF